MVKLHAGEAEIDDDLVQALLVEQFPSYADRPISRVSSSGTVNVVYRLGADLCLRLPRLETFTESLEREQRWLPILASHLSVAIPEPVAQGRPGMGYPFPWAIYRWLEGEIFESIPSLNQVDAAETLAGFIGELRAFHAPDAPRSKRGLPLSARDAHARKAITSLTGKIDTRAALAAWEECLQAPEWDKQPVWTHGDLLPSNLLVRERRLCAVLDFGNTGVGDPAIDVTAAWEVFSPEARGAFRSKLGVIDAVWTRSRGFALFQALLGISYYWETNRRFVRMKMRTFDEIQAELC